MTSSVISHSSPIKSPDWLYLKVMPPESAATNLTAILKAYDNAEKQVFAIRGYAALLIEERQLYRFVVDEEVGDYYTSMDRFIKQEFPNSGREIRAALSAVKELKDMNFADLLDMKRCNVEQLKKVSSSVRSLPEVVQAAKTLPEKQFVKEVNEKFDQHLTAKEPLIMADPAVSDRRHEAVELAKALYGCKSEGEALEAIFADFCLSHSAEVEHMEEATA